MGKLWRVILICQHCESSCHVRPGDLPTRCHVCHEQGYWRVALAWEFTAFDRRLLRSLRIAADGEP